MSGAPAAAPTAAVAPAAAAEAAPAPAAAGAAAQSALLAPEAATEAASDDPQDDLRRQAQATLPLALPQPKPTCLASLAQSQGKTPLSHWVQGEDCPSAPAPACLKLLALDTGGTAHAYCAPGLELFYMLDVPWARCPANYREVTGDDDFSTLAWHNGRSRLCQRLSSASGAGARPDPACAFVNRRWVCPIPVPGLAGYELSTDREPPPRPSFDTSGTAAGGLQSVIIVADDNGPPGQIPFRLKASDPNGLGAVELLEDLGLVLGGESGQLFERQLVRRWRSDPATVTGAAVTNYHGPLFHVPFSVTDPAKRAFIVRAYDRAGNSTRSVATRVYERHLNSIAIQSFTATPATLPPGGGQVTLNWSFWLASAASIDNGVGAVPAADTASYYSQGSRVVNVTANTTFTLTATRPDRLPKTASASVTVQADTSAPSVSLSASPPSVVAPGSSTLSANASDATGVAKVEFYRGAMLIATDFTPPYQHTLNLTLADVGNAGYSAKAYDAAGNVGTSNLISLSVLPDTTPPTVSLVASPTSLQLPASSTLTATAADAFGITKVEFYRGSTLIATDFSAPFSHVVSFGAGDAGNASFTAKAFDPQGNSTTSSAVVVAVAPDTTPPTISLQASPATVVLPGGTTLNATAADAVGVTKVEFYRGASLIATDTTAPFSHSITFGNGDIGNISFTAKAFDAQNNATTSTAVLVAVSAPVAGDTYASPTGVDTGNTTCALASPCLAISKAASLAGAGKTVWLADGVYIGTQSDHTAVIPAGLTVRAATVGGATLKLPLQLQGSATVVGLVMDSSGNFAYQNSIIASAGTVVLDAIRFAGLIGTNPPLNLSGTALVTLTPGTVADYSSGLTFLNGSYSTFAELKDSAQLTINGGQLGGTALGSADYYGYKAAFVLSGNTRLALNNVAVQVGGHGIYMASGTPQVSMNNASLTGLSTVFFSTGIVAHTGAPVITLVNSTISGFKKDTISAGIIIGAGEGNGWPAVTASITLTGAVLSGNARGLAVINNTGPTQVTLLGSGAQISNNLIGGLVCEATCNIDLNGGQISGNGNANNIPALSQSGFFGGMHLGRTDRAYTLKLRNVSVINNYNLNNVPGAAPRNTPDNSGLTLAGNASSSFDLGTAASPGGNTFTGNNSGNQTSGIHVKAAAGVVVQAVGNTFIANTQGTNAQGKYVLGTAPCAAGSCNLSTGDGGNYRVVTGTLRLAQ